MKKIFLFLILLSTFSATAKDVIYKTTDGTQLKCTYKKTQGSIGEFDKATPYYYTFENRKLYSRSMFEMFASSWRKKYKKNTPRVLRLKITDEKITFNEYCSTDTGVVSKRNEINRKTGKYTFKAERYYHWSGRTMYRKRAEGTGKCVIVK